MRRNKLEQRWWDKYSLLIAAATAAGSSIAAIINLVSQIIDLVGHNRLDLILVIAK